MSLPPKTHAARILLPRDPNTPDPDNLPAERQWLSVKLRCPKSNTRWGTKLIGACLVRISTCVAGKGLTGMCKVHKIRILINDRKEVREILRYARFIGPVVPTEAKKHGQAGSEEEGCGGPGGT